jgi:hypothetical protein
MHFKCKALHPSHQRLIFPIQTRHRPVKRLIYQMCHQTSCLRFQMPSNFFFLYPHLLHHPRRLLEADHLKLDLIAIRLNLPYQSVSPCQ